MNAPARLRDLAFVFGGIALTSFGGGQKAQIRRACVERGWLSDDAFIEALEIAQLMPGPNILNLAVYIGRAVRGVPGAIVAFLAGTLPPFAIVLVAGWWYFSPYNTPVTHAALRGCAAAAIGLTFANAFELTADHRKSVRELAIVAATALAVALLHLHLLVTLALFGGLGIALVALGRRSSTA